MALLLLFLVGLATGQLIQGDLRGGVDIAEIEVKVGDRIVFDSELLPGAPPDLTKVKFYWKKLREWDPSIRFDQLGKDGTCLKNEYLHGRLVSCNSSLILENATFSDEGIYMVRYKMNDTHSEESVILLRIFDSQPVLMLSVFTGDRLSFRCDDLKNGDADMRVELKNVPGFDPGLLERAGHYVWDLRTIKWTKDQGFVPAFLVRNQLRCCAQYASQMTCGPWTPVTVDMFLDDVKAANRDMCPNRGGLKELEGVDMTSPRNTPLWQPRCYRRVYSVTENNGHLVMCEGHEGVVLGPTGTWKMHRPLGGVRTLFVGRRYAIEEIERNITGEYFINTPNGTHDAQFNITVLAPLQASLKLVSLDEHSLTMECEHNGRPGSRITWTVEGTFAESQVSGSTIRLWQDCRETPTQWAFQVAVQCAVDDGPWQVRSKWYKGTRRRGEGSLCTHCGHF
ncbi:hypothetical protein RHVP.R18 [Cricetid gammaherpesvirus 2]|uniref:Ig-like domain-containing protein n=1 Tax=Cricetid gammaherpesvirus 2 TaxID=1605972 RepID=E9M5R1_9GAMA|nr:hypothetical protein RHVP.R18 [Cricetid gammaherpesvirus 2]ADW24419.1 hypothetical protein RHVP.R18 [Cricetid gammaherpesvirus 2]ADW24501.1 hypothetical protein RHVP-L.R18 [Cricetid gammaherpesvirus 2]